MCLLALLTRFRHHRPDGGDKRLIKELEERHGLEIAEWGNDETDLGFPRGALEPGSNQQSAMSTECAAKSLDDVRS